MAVEGGERGRAKDGKPSTESGAKINNVIGGTNSWKY
jgi:hypothetical protein